MYAEVISDATMHELEGGEDKDVADEGSEDDIEGLTRNERVRSNTAMRMT